MLVLAEHPLGVLLGLLVGLLLALEIGRVLGRRQLAAAGGTHAGTSAVDGVIFALLGLLLAFTFTGAAQRFDTRRELIVARRMRSARHTCGSKLPPKQPSRRSAMRSGVTSRPASRSIGASAISTNSR